MLARAALGQEDSPLPKHVVSRTVDLLLIEVTVVAIQPNYLDWALDVVKYLDNNEMPDDRQEAQKV